MPSFMLVFSNFHNHCLEFWSIELKSLSYLTAEWVAHNLKIVVSVSLISNHILSKIDTYKGLIQKSIENILQQLFRIIFLKGSLLDVEILEWDSNFGSLNRCRRDSKFGINNRIA
jgi:hypothetical protein